MTEEEKKAVDKINKLVKYLRKWNKNVTVVPEDIKYFEKILDMIKTYIRMIDENIEEILEQSKVIDEMAEKIYKLKVKLELNNLSEDCFIPREFSDINDCIKRDCKECIKQYFYRKVEEDD